MGHAIVVAGFQSVDAYPMRWRGRVLGGLNVFRAQPGEQSAKDQRLCQAFADIATLVLVQSAAVPSDMVLAQVHEAVTARIQVEQARGVLAHLLEVELAEAYELLLRRAEEDGRGLSETARQIVREQYEG